MSLERLIREHDEIDQLSHDLRAITRQAPPSPLAAVASLQHLARSVEDHLSYEDRTVYSVLVDRYAASPSFDADKFEKMFEELRDSWLAYLAKWDVRSVRADWSSFCADTSEMIPRLQARVRNETNLIYSLALSDGTIRLRDPA
jgi:hypothetical protein